MKKTLWGEIENLFQIIFRKGLIFDHIPSYTKKEISYIKSLLFLLDQLIIVSPFVCTLQARQQKPSIAIYYVTPYCNSATQHNDWLLESQLKLRVSA